MDLTIQQIYMELTRRSDFETNLSYQDRRKIGRVQMISDQREIVEEQVLYLLFPQGELFLTGDVFFRWQAKGDALALMNLVQEVFSFLYQVKTDLRTIAIQQQNYSQLLLYAEEKLEVALLLVDRNLHYLAETPSYRRLNYSWMGDYEDITIEWINVLEQDEAFMDAINHIGCFEYGLPDDTEGEMAYCYNVRVGGVYEARLLVQSLDQTRFYGGFDWTEEIGGLIAQIFANNYDQISQASEAFRFYELIQELAEDQAVNPEEVRQILSRTRWEQTDTYQVFLFRPQQKISETINLRYYQAVIKKLMNECSVFESGQQICCVRNITRTESIYHDIRRQLSEFLRENLFYVGISNEFQDLLQLKYYYMEAKVALQAGRGGNSTSWSSYYSDWILPHLMDLTLKTLPKEEWMHPALRTLQAYDEREGTELVHTACEYMKHQYSVTHTAQALYIHRTTLLFRLQRIKILTGLDWSRMEDRALLMLNYMMLQ